VASILFTTMGSWGDLFPFVGVAVELQRRGHAVRIGASPAWHDIVTEAGIDFVPLGRRVGFEEFAQHPEIFGRMPFGLPAALQHFVFDQIDELTRDLEGSMTGADLLVTHPAHIAAHNVAERLGVPRVVGTVFPSMIPSAHTVPGGTRIRPWSGGLGRLMNRAAWRSASVSTAVLFDRPINRHRRALGLPPVRAGLLRLPMTARRTVVMASPAVVDQQPDWPRSITATSFVAWDRAEQRPVPPATEAFLHAGSPPVLITLGASSAVDAGDFFEHVTSEVVATGARALVITGPASPPPNHFDPDRVHITGFVPFSAVARRCRAGIHHAGIGTTVAVMRAGIPHLAVPKGFDQPDTAALIERLGIGIAIRWRQRNRHMHAAVARLLDDGELRRRAGALGKRLAEEDGARSSAAAVEAALNP
jgi:rhamnosyltransferase subunit B